MKLSPASVPVISRGPYGFPRQGCQADRSELERCRVGSGHGPLAVSIPSTGINSPAPGRSARPNPPAALRAQRGFSRPLPVDAIPPGPSGPGHGIAFPISGTHPLTPATTSPMFPIREHGSADADHRQGNASDLLGVRAQGRGPVAGLVCGCLQGGVDRPCRCEEGVRHDRRFRRGQPGDLRHWRQQVPPDRAFRLPVSPGLIKFVGTHKEYDKINPETI